MSVQFEQAPNKKISVLNAGENFFKKHVSDSLANWNSQSDLKMLQYVWSNNLVSWSGRRIAEVFGLWEFVGLILNGTG